MPPQPLKDNLRKRTTDDLRDERDQLGGWIRQPEVRWLDPSILAKAGVEVAVSGTFGKFADKREIQTSEQGPFDYTSSGEMWIDYLSDTGDGWAATQTMAWVLAQPSLTVDGEPLPCGEILLLGGDQVYPSATPEAYEDRFKGPFAAALPRSEPGAEPDMYATPGNHDWYDGLVSFLRLFCTGGWIGGWRTRQRRSYFALKLPGNWWIWAIDIQLDTYIDDVQLKYFTDQGIGVGDKIILLTAKPSWVSAVDARVEPPTWKFLSYFEERMVRDSGARLVLTLTGDRHHYARYEPEGGDGADEAPTRITAGGGGAYLSATHTLADKLVLKPLPRKVGDTYVDQPAVVNRREAIYPSDADSRRLSNGILKLAALNPAFGRLLGVIYALVGIAILSGRNVDEGIATQSFGGFLSQAAGFMGVIVLAALLFGGIYGGADVKPVAGESRTAVSLQRFAISLAQTLVHLVVAAFTIWLATEIAPEIWAATIFLWIVGLPLAFLAGATIGATVFAVFMWIVHKVRVSKAQACANQVFTGQSIPDYKNLLRMRLGRDGSLTIWALGVDHACTEWDLADPAPAPRFEPRGPAPKVERIDGPLQFDASGNRL
ncbi:MAG: metallophosphoesterase [Solirubrobacterales bacterium]|nr:metallophosphoesterase [Solirubrobacterales bacterium]